MKMVLGERGSKVTQRTSLGPIRFPINHQLGECMCIKVNDFSDKANHGLPDQPK